jgi:hypothetical protein
MKIVKLELIQQLEPKPDPSRVGLVRIKKIEEE